MSLDQITRIGEVNWFGVGIEQGKNGVELDLKAHPKIEEYFMASSGGATVPIENLGGKAWFDPKGIGLKIYKVTSGSPLDEEGISINMPGHSFSLGSEVGGPYMDGGYNISLLRLVGISSPNGVKLGVKGIMSLQAQRNLAKQLTQSVKKFVRGYINTARVEFRLVGREVGVSYTKDF